MPSYAEITLIGHIGQTPELKRVGNRDTALLEFSIAVNRYSKNDDDETDWFRVALWGSMAERHADPEKPKMQLRKGDLVFVKGTPRGEKYTRRDETTVESIKIHATWLQKLSRSNVSENRARDGRNRTSRPPPREDDIPF